MALLKSTYKRWNGSAWDIHYFRTSADVIDETTSYKVMTADERIAIGTYLNNFNIADHLLKLDGDGLIPVGLIPGGLDYLTTSNPTFTGNLTGSTPTGYAVIPGGLWAQATQQEGIKFTADAITLVAEGSDVLSIYGPNDYVDFYGRKLLTVTPTLANHAATKGYVDGLIATGTKPRDAVKAATTANITLSGLQTIDGFTPGVGDRILVKNQTTTSQNGIYTASSTAWTKVTADSVQGVLVFVENGNTNNDTQYYAATDTSWSLFSRVDTITASTGLTKVGTDIRVATGGITNTMLAGSIATSKIADFGSGDSASWGSIEDAGVAVSLSTHFSNIYSAIRNVRGTAAYNSDNAQTISDVYSIANSKNRTYVGASDPATSGYVSGDIYLQDIV